MTMTKPPKRPGTEHGYGAYSNGCRCSVCQDAKRVRQRALRDVWRVLYQTHKDQFDYPYVVEANITHGYAAYVNFFCRCEVCTAAKARCTQRARELKNNPQVGS